MKEHKAVAALLQQAEEERRCAIGDGGSLYHALRRRVKARELAAPYPNLFIRMEYWLKLNKEEQSMHMIRALAQLHPKWAFAGLSAACLYRYDHAYSLHDGSISIASTCGAQKTDHERLNRIYMKHIPLWQCRGIFVTSPARTLLDCARLPFINALAIYDSALRSRLVTAAEVSTLAVQVDCDEASIAKLLKSADPLSENGGESMARGQFQELGFAAPHLQVEFNNPNNPRAPYRVDFCWKLADGRIIVGEYDGMAKYGDVSNPNRASLQAKFAYEREREDHLKASGVTTILHLFYEDVMEPQRLMHKLLNAGVPRLR